MMLFLSLPLCICCLVLAFVLGAVLGSFLNCAAWRLCHGESVLRGRSHCALCGHVLGPWELIPLLSYLAQGGKCRHCGGRISPRYPLVELLSALSFVSLLLRYDLSWSALRYLLLLCLLLYGALVDQEEGWIPDRVSVLAILAYVPLAYLEGGWRLLVSGLLSGAGIFLVLLGIVLLLEKILKTEAMGGGDLKLFGVLGLYFGWKQGIFLILVACLLGLGALALGGRLHKRAELRFGPMLYLAAWICALGGQPFLDWYLGLF